MNTPPDTIPSEVVAPILKRVIADYGMFLNNCGDRGWHAHEGPNGGTGFHNASSLVASVVGGTTTSISRNLQRICSGEHRSASIDFVDGFLVALGAHHLWYVPPLSDYYFSQAILDMPEEDCGDDLMFFHCCNRWGTSKQKVTGQSRQCRSCRNKYNMVHVRKWREKAA